MTINRRDLLRYAGLSSTLLHPGLQALARSASAVAAGTAEPVLLNQLGYLPSEVKQASVRLADASARSFLVRSLASHSVVYQGTLLSPAADVASGDSLALADFSNLRAPGQYRLEVGSLVSDAFPVADRAYADGLRVAMRGFTGQRCGCAIDLGNGYRHAACHGAGAFHPTSGRSGSLPNHGGWHDAGDYGRYIVNSGISTGTLLWAWELYPAAVSTLALNLPESGGKLPDYLAEIRWNLEWMLQLQDEDGGVWHKQTSEHFCGFILPEADTLPSYVIGTGAAPYKSTCATADLAAVMAIAARCYGPFDDLFAARCLAAARRAYTWAAAHPDVPFHNPPSIATGDYGDTHCADELAWAAAELWRTTGDSVYQGALLAALPPAGTPLRLEAPGWGSVFSMACWTYALSERPGDAATKARIREATARSAAVLLDRAGSSGYGNTLALTDYNWGSNSVAGNQSLLLLVSHYLQASPAARSAALGNLHYLLGRNCFAISWVTQLGTRPFLHPHHRPSAADGIAAPWPGLLSGGPNAGGGDPVANSLPKRPPMRMWVDDQRAYSLNEIAINWNAPLVFLLAAANT